jgi:hypothetical protein
MNATKTIIVNNRTFELRNASTLVVGDTILVGYSKQEAGYFLPKKAEFVPMRFKMRNPEVRRNLGVKRHIVTGTNFNQRGNGGITFEPLNSKHIKQGAKVYRGDKVWVEVK